MKKITSLLLALLLILSFAITASAAGTAAKSGIQVAISSNADAYFEEEPIKITVKVKNANKFAVNDVAVATVLPDGLHLEKGASQSLKFNLAAGESKSVKFIAYADRVPDLPSCEKPGKPAKPNDCNTNPTKSNFGELEGEGCLPTDAECAGDDCLPTDDCKKPSKDCDKKEKCKGDGTCDETCYCKQPCTGDSFNAFLWVVVLMFAVAAGVLVLKGNKKAIKTLCVVFCLLMALAVIPVDTLAAAEAIVVDTTVQVGAFDYTVKAKVAFDLGGKAPVNNVPAPAQTTTALASANDALPEVATTAPVAQATTSVLEAGFEAISGVFSGLEEDGTMDKIIGLFK